MLLRVLPFKASSQFYPCFMQNRLLVVCIVWLCVWVYYPYLCCMNVIFCVVFQSFIVISLLAISTALYIQILIIVYLSYTYIHSYIAYSFLYTCEFLVFICVWVKNLLYLHIHMCALKGFVVCCWQTCYLLSKQQILKQQSAELVVVNILPHHPPHTLETHLAI